VKAHFKVLAIFFIFSPLLIKLINPSISPFTGPSNTSARVAFNFSIAA
jgi:hypothetical protein